MDKFDALQSTRGRVNDIYRQNLEKSGNYSTRSLYRHLMFRGVLCKRMDRLWKNKAALKIRIFMWMAVKDKLLQSGVNLKEKKMARLRKLMLV